MKKIGLILFALMLMSVGAVAQQNAGGRERRAPRMDKATMVKRMTDNQVKRLKLTKEQTEQMNVLNEAYVTEMMAQGPQRNDSIPRREMSREERDAQRKAREARMNEMRNNYVTLAKAILTPEQFKEFEKMQKVYQAILADDIAFLNECLAERIEITQNTCQSFFRRFPAKAK